jgi:hypothetical protein
MCMQPADCPDPGNECILRTCDAGMCGTEPAISGTPLAMQIPGDCKEVYCDGSGSTEQGPSDTDLPNDANDCTSDVCTDGVPSNPPLEAGAACGATGDLVCDGAGSCVGCVAETDCAGMDTECQTRTCIGGVCGVSNAPPGTPVAAQVPGDCKQNQCDGSGGVETVNNNNDVPVDNNACSQDICSAGLPSNPPEPVGTACSEGSGVKCDGGGACVECLGTADCPGQDTECQARTCAAGACGVAFTAAGTAVSEQQLGDCKTAVCNGSGGTTTVNNDADLPVDNNPCTGDVCSGGAPSNPFLPQNTMCGGGLVCNAAGQCAGCSMASQCPGTDDECKTRTCTAGTCGFNFTPQGTSVAAQTPGDCQKNQCDGAGNIESVAENADVPADDGQECTGDVCVAGAPQHPPKLVDTPCSQGGGSVCSAGGQCVACNVASQCAGQDTECSVRSCMSNTCGISNLPPGTPTSMQAPGDCKVNQCDGLGNVVVAADNTDLPPDDGNQCTLDVCTAGAPAHPASSPGAPCSQMGGAVCNGAGACVQCVSGGMCPSGVCVSNACAAATCTDTVKNGAETGVDCGGGVCPACADGQTCAMSTDCQSGTCSSGVCVAATCSDGMKNGTETDIDCGGGACLPCAAGKACVAGSDCATGACQGSICVVAPTVTATSPADAATGVVTPGALSVTFSVAMTPASLTTQTAAGACSGSIQVSLDNFATCIGFSAASAVMNMSNTVATVTPVPGLELGRLYKIRVTTAATSSTGANLKAQFTQATGFTTAAYPASCVGGVVISQVYGAGGNAGATYKNDFIELYNGGAVAVDLSTWAVHYASTVGSTWAKTNLSGSIAPGGYFLVKEAAGAAGDGANLPAAEVTGTLAMAAGAGKIVLTNNQTLIASGTSCPSGANVVDIVGYGTGTNCVEGTGPTPAPSTTLSAIRKGFGCSDTADNAADFVASLVTPRNSASGSPMNESGAAAEADYCVLLSPATLSAAAGQSTATVLGRIFETGVTEAAGASASVVAQVGYGPVTANPENQLGWTWVNAAFTQQTGPLGNDDEYGATFTAPAMPGTYAYTFRFATDGPVGQRWTYCDLNGAGSNVMFSFNLGQLGVLTVSP